MSTQYVQYPAKASSGTGTVTSVGLSDTSTTPIFSISGSPVTGSGTLSFFLATQAKNLVFAGPSSGSNAQPGFRTLVGADLPFPAIATLGGVFSKAAVSHQFLTSISSVDGSVGQAQPAFTDISGTASAAQIPLPGVASLGGSFSKAVVAHNFLTGISSVDGSVSQAQPAFADISGSVAASQLPLPAAASLGGVFSKAAVSHQFLTSISSVDGSVGQAQPAFTDISGSVAASQLPNPSASTLGGIQSLALVASRWISSISTSGVPSATQPAFTDISGTLGIGAGGTGQTSATLAFNALSPMTALGDLIYGGTSPAGQGTRLAGNTTSTKQFLSQTGTGSVSAAPAWSSFTAPTIQKFLSTGTTTGWLFTISTSTTCAVGDTYTNNSNTYTVLGALSAQTGQVLFMSGASAPQASGTLTRSAGAGTASVTFSSNVALATYTTPAGALYLKIRVVGGGGGGGGSGTVAPGVGGSGTISAFGANLLIANGGGGGASASGGSGGGGTASLGTAIGIALQGGNGQGFGTNSTTGTDQLGGSGAASPFGGGGGGGAYGPGVGFNAIANTGSGGGGAGNGGGASQNFSGGGGGSGGYVDVIISSPNATYYYCIGSGGSAGAAGTGGSVGGTGATGLLIVEEHYQ